MFSKTKNKSFSSFMAKRDKPQPIKKNTLVTQNKNHSNLPKDNSTIKSHKNTNNKNSELKNDTKNDEKNERINNLIKNIKINNTVNTMNKIFDENQKTNTQKNDYKQPKLDQMLTNNQKNIYNCDIDLFVDHINIFEEKINKIQNYLK